MTTQVPPGPEPSVTPPDYPQFVTGHAQYPPVREHFVPHQPRAMAPAYPTAPQWAARASAAAAAVPMEQPQHGGLLVRFPDEMRHVSRARPPAVWPVAVFTLLFGILGAVSAKRRAAQARRGRNSTAPYWMTFLLTATAGAFLWFVVAVVVVGPGIDGIREHNRLAAVQRNVISDGQLKKARIDATAAKCRAANERDAEGRREYLCRLTLANGKTASLALTADTDGRWRSRPAA